MANTSRGGGMLWGVSPDAVLGELEGLRALARSLVHGDADADDLLQEAAIAAIAQPPADTTRPLRPWLATVLRNRWKMDRRTRSRRELREQVSPLADAPVRADEVLDRARTLERLAAALVALDEPFRTVVIRRYLDGESAAEIARALGVPAGTVRWRLKTGLERLRAALTEKDSRWQLALAPLAAKGTLLVKTKTTVISLALLVLLLVGGVVALLVTRGDDGRGRADPVAGAKAPGGTTPPVSSLRVADADVTAAPPAPAPGQRRARVMAVDAAAGVLSGRVINWSTGDGVAGAELTFTSDSGATTVRSAADGSFELAPSVPGTYSLQVAVAQGFLPFAPELAHSSVRAELVARQAVRDVTVFLFPALDYRGLVVDANKAPVAGARVRLVGTPQGEQAIEKLESEWTTDKDGAFTFHAPDGAVFEATHAGSRGWARLTGNVATTRTMTITLGTAAARDRSIRGRTVDEQGVAIPDVLVRALPESPGVAEHTRAEAFALSGSDGSFVLEGLDAGDYTVLADVDDHAPVTRTPVAGGTRDLVLTLTAGRPLAGRVETSDGEPVPAFTLLVLRKQGLVRELVVDRSVVDPRGRFSVRVPPGDYELLAASAGWSPSAPVAASAGTTDVTIVLAQGATLRGTVVDADTGAALQYARVSREGAGGGASAQPANAGTVTRADGSFELTGIPAGPLTITVGAGDYHPRLESGLSASDGAQLGPVRIALKRLGDGEQPKLELVGIGVRLAADRDALRVDEVIANGGAADAGIIVGDRIVALDGVAVSQLGMEGAVARIRGVAGTTISVALARGETQLQLVVTRKSLRY